MKSLLDPADRRQLLTRLQMLSPAAPARWGELTAPRMLAHLCDSLLLMLGEIEVRSHDSALRWPLLKPLVMYWLPWPKGRIKGPRALFRTPPGNWDSDQARFVSLLERFTSDTTRPAWPEHPLFGAMTHRSWGRFGYRHVDHHLRQFRA